MRHLTILILSTLTMHLSYSQINEIGVFVGGSNFIGDVGATNYINPNALSVGALYKWNKSKRHSWRASLIYSELSAKDSKSDDPRRQQRNYNFDSNILELAAGLEFTFLDFDLHTGEKVATPYLFSGIAFAKHDDYYYLNGIQTPDNGTSWTLGIPMALGFKASFIRGIVLGIEVGARYTFSDSLEGSTPANSNNQQYQFGNLNNSDWYVFSGFTLTYTFGQNPCYCVN